ncbi:MAG: YciI family protein [Proteobacteria bacterium]|nr:YciI family protein [Pseudomonadota bacterium]
MKVMMLILESPEDFDNRGGGPAAKAYWDQWKAYSQAVGDKVVGGNVLDRAETALTLRVRDGRRDVQDGPFADSKEALGGYMVFDVSSMDEALELAASCPAAANGAVELRPIVPMDAV